MENLLYWLWLTSKPVMSPAKIVPLMERFGSVEEIYRAERYTGIPNIKEAEKKALCDKSLDKAQSIREECERMGARIITFDDEDYPSRLRNITPPPYILYERGDMSGINEVLTIGVIGTRKHYTPYGKMVTERLSSELARNGVLVVSGMAEGLDSCAAVGALRGEGRTIAVIGSGLDIVYPKRNKALMEEIIEHGAVITEYPPGSQALSNHFPQRNRIIAGLSNGLLVTEAKAHSGTKSTVKFAMEYNRDVFAVPGSIYEPNCEGTNRYIQQGAKLVTCVQDILEEYPYAVREIVPRKKPAAVPDLDEDGDYEEQIDDDSGDEWLNGLIDADKCIVSLLMKKDMNIDEMAEELGAGASELNVRLTLLEMKKLVKRMPGGVYKLAV